jgi:sterol desaturase/sphingolipid hydroxylase (fatty acid hydroxylase superfamily)
VGIAIGFVFVVLFALLAVEFVAPARRFESVPGWRAKCLAFVPMVVALSSGLPMLLEGVTEPLRLLPGDRLGVFWGTVVGVLSSEFLVYWAHRLHHDVRFLWRWIHQLHHSAERMDVFGAAYFHPFEIAEGTIIGFVFFTVVLGLTPEATALSMIWQAFAGVFQHGNIKTPRWLGYLIQRPEQHGLHHQRGVHGYNYANLPFWDLLFGTFRNPKDWEGLSGFYSVASRRLLPMLLGRNVTEGPRAS